MLQKMIYLTLLISLLIPIQSNAKPITAQEAAKLSEIAEKQSIENLIMIGTDYGDCSLVTGRNLEKHREDLKKRGFEVFQNSSGNYVIKWCD